MSDPRSRNLEDKPKAKAWLLKNESKLDLFNFVLETLKSSFFGENSGYVNMAPPQYRFNSLREGGYLIIKPLTNGNVIINLGISRGHWEGFEITRKSELKQVIANGVFNFKFNPTDLNKEFYEKVAKSQLDSSDKRKKRLTKANPKPKKILRQVTLYDRNPDVVAEVLNHANGFCDLCNEKAPFVRKKDGTPYLEVHHKDRLADGGNDTVENAIALCPNCHRKEHFG